MDLLLKETILDLIQSNTARTQQEICLALRQKNFDVNQTKISRLLHKMGVIKIKDMHGKLTYHVNQEQNSPQNKSLIAETIIHITANQNMIVISTQPGAASMVSRLLDFHKNELDLLGTVAGDDTIFIAPTDTRQIEKILADLKEFLF